MVCKLLIGMKLIEKMMSVGRNTWKNVRPKMHNNKTIARIIKSKGQVSSQMNQILTTAMQLQKRETIAPPQK